jgi:nucleotide-binding universal stress UspA family protein
MSIICGSDLSAASAGALEVALALARLRGDREVVLAHVVDPEVSSPGTINHARGVIAGQTAPAAGGDPAIRAELVLGPPDEALVGLAEAEARDLIVIAARSTTGSLLRLGSTAAKVIARATVPVVVVRDPAPWLAYARAERPLRVLLGIDDSATCDLGIEWTHALASRGPVDVVLGAIYYPDDAAAYYGLDLHGMVDSDPEIERMMARDLVRRFGEVDPGAPPFSAPSVVARPRRGLGRIGDHMLELARDEKVDVIVVGTSQKTGLGRLGSVSSVIVEDARQSVVCVPPQARAVTRTVPVMRAALVATDLSPFANRAVPYAFAVAEPDAEIHILHVVEEDDEIDDAERSRQLFALAPRGTRHAVHAHVVRGDDAATAIAQAAARFGVDIICIASHGRSGITRALVGSVADRLLRATRLPVLVLRPR